MQSKKNKNAIFRKKLIQASFALIGGVLVTLSLNLFINVLANYSVEKEKPKKLLVVDLMSMPSPVKHKDVEKQKKVTAKTKKRKVEKKSNKITPKPALVVNKKLKEKPPEIENLDQPEKIVEETPKIEEIEKRFEITQSKPTPTPVKSAINPLPTPVPIFQLTQAPHFLHRETPVYPESMRTQGISAIVKLEALIDKEGQVRKVNIIKSAGKLFDEAARRAIMASSFYPAKIDNKHVAVLLRIPVKYRLN